MRSISQQGFNERPPRLIQSKLSQLKSSSINSHRVGLQPMQINQNCVLPNHHLSEIQPPDSILNQQLWSQDYPSKVPNSKMERLWLSSLVCQLTDCPNTQYATLIQLLFEINRHLYLSHKIPCLDQNLNPYIDLIVSNEKLIHYLMKQCENNELGSYIAGLDTIGEQRQQKELFDQYAQENQQLKIEIIRLKEKLNHEELLRVQTEIEIQRVQKFKDDRYLLVSQLEDQVKQLKLENQTLLSKIPRKEQIQEKANSPRKDPNVPPSVTSLSNISSTLHPRQQQSSPLLPNREILNSYKDMLQSNQTSDTIALQNNFGGSLKQQQPEILHQFDITLESKIDVINQNQVVDIGQIGKIPQTISGYSRAEQAAQLMEMPDSGNQIEQLIEPPINQLNMITTKNCQQEVLDMQDIEYNQLNREIAAKKRNLLMTASVEEDNILQIGQRVVDFITNVGEDSANTQERTILEMFAEKKAISKGVGNMTASYANMSYNSVFPKIGGEIMGYYDKLIEERAFSKIKPQFSTHEQPLSSIVNPLFKNEIVNDDFELQFPDNSMNNQVYNQPKFVQRHNSIVGSILKTGFGGSGYSKVSTENMEGQMKEQLNSVTKTFLRENNKDNLIFNLQSDNIFSAGTALSAKSNPFDQFIPNLTTQFVAGEANAAQQDELRVVNSQLEREQVSSKSAVKRNQKAKDMKPDLPISDLVFSYCKKGGKEFPSPLQCYDYCIQFVLQGKGLKFTPYGMKMKPMCNLGKLIVPKIDQEFQEFWNGKDFRSAVGETLEKPHDKFYKRIIETVSGKNKEIPIPEQYEYTQQQIGEQYFRNKVGKLDIFLFEFPQLLKLIDELLIRRAKFMDQCSQLQSNCRSYIEFGKFVGGVIYEEYDYDSDKASKYIISLYFSTVFYTTILDLNCLSAKKRWLNYDDEKKELSCQQQYLSCGNYVLLLFLNLMNDNLSNVDAEFAVFVYHQLHVQSRFSTTLIYTFIDYECAQSVFNQVFKLTNAPSYVQLVMAEGNNQVLASSIQFGDKILTDVGQFIYVCMKVRDQLNKLFFVKIIKDSCVSEDKVSFEEYVKLIYVQRPTLKVDQQPFVEIVKAIYSTALLQFNNTSPLFLLQQSDLLISSEVYNSVNCSFYEVFVQSFPILQLNRLFYNVNKRPSMYQNVDSDRLQRVFLGQNLRIASRLSQLLITEGFGLSPFGDRFVIPQKGESFALVGARFGKIDAQLRFVGETDRSEVMAGRQLANVIQHVSGAAGMPGIRLLISGLISNLGRLKLFSLSNGEPLELDLYAQLIAVVDHFMSLHVSYKSSMEASIGIRFDESVLTNMQEFLLHLRNRICILEQ